MDEKARCQNCKSYKQPRCLKYDKYIARKNTCDEFERKG